MNLYDNDRYEAPCSCKSGLKRGTIAGHADDCEYRLQQERRRYAASRAPQTGAREASAR